jgi:adenosine deaminase
LPGVSFGAPADRYESFPKVELHLHLEGAIPLDALWELCLKYGPDPSVPDLDALSRRFEYRDFPHFIETWIWKNGFLREYEDFAFIAEKVAGDLARQQIHYAEVHYSPPDFVRHGLKTEGITAAVREGLSRVPEVEVGLIIDLVRDFGPEKAAITLREAREVKGLGVIGVGLGGSEHSFPPELFTHVFEQARQFGFHTTAHAGEAAGAASIWGAVKGLGVERIGHGTKAYEDEALLDFLVDRQIPLEMCPLSNVRTGVTARIEEHPIRRYFDRGLLVTVNTDDPKMFGNSLAEEYRTLETVFGFSEKEVRAIAANGARASWMSEERKHAMIERIMAWPSIT